MFQIVELPAAGGQIAISPMPGRGGDYARDFAILHAWGPDAVLSMTERAEFGGPLSIDLARAGIAWEHLPIRDFGAPPAQIQALWPEVSARLLGVLGRGGRVLVHCYGGCGRSGMAALRLMIEAGEGADVALARLRAARPCAVETDGQMAWATAPGV